MDIVRLSVPGSLRYRDVVLRVVASTCRLVRPVPLTKQETSREAEFEDFETKVVSAVSEAFNNVAIHAYRGGSVGSIEVELEPDEGGLTIRLLDRGAGYDPKAPTAPDLDALPESNMGLHLMRSCMDRVEYRPGDPPSTPNVLTLTKRYPVAAE